MLGQLKQSAGRNVKPAYASIWPMPANSRLAPRKFDLVATHFFLDCLTTVEVESLAMRLRVKDRDHPTHPWVISEYAIPDNWYGRLIAQAGCGRTLSRIGMLDRPRHPGTTRARGSASTSWIRPDEPTEFRALRGPPSQRTLESWPGLESASHTLIEKIKRGTLSRLYCSSVS